jgi:hypothetical protein
MNPEDLGIFEDTNTSDREIMGNALDSLCNQLSCPRTIYIKLYKAPTNKVYEWCDSENIGGCYTSGMIVFDEKVLRCKIISHEVGHAVSDTLFGDADQNHVRLKQWYESEVDHICTHLQAK